jgi:hypothetical protein
VSGSPSRASRASGLALKLALVALAAGLVLPAAAQATTGIKGTVTGPGPVDEVEVCIVEPLPSETCTYPGAGGNYELLGIDPGIYQVEFLPSYQSHLVAQYFNHKAKLSEANKVAVSANVITPGVNASLELGGEIEGQATDALSGLGVEEVEVCAQDAVNGTAVSCTHTDADGEYALPSLPPGSYRVGFWGERQSAAYAPRYYDEKPSFFEATNIAVGAGATIAGIDAGLHVGARVSGTVSDSATGSPLGGIAVCILKNAAGAPERCAYSGPAGEYTLPGVVTGTYLVAFSPEFNEFSSEEFVLPEEDGWHTQYYEGSETRAGATALALTAPQTRSDVDAALLTTFAPPPPQPPPPAPNTAIPVPTIVPPPPEKRKTKKCRKGYRKRKVKGTVRCVKVHKHQKKQAKRHSAQAAGRTA